MVGTGPVVRWRRASLLSLGKDGAQTPDPSGKVVRPFAIPTPALDMEKDYRIEAKLGPTTRRSRL